MKHTLLWFTSIVHIVWGIAFLVPEEASLRTSALAPSENIIQNVSYLGFLLIIVGILGIIGSLRFERWEFRLFLVPQFVFVLLSFLGAVDILVQGHYADGTVRSLNFMLVDQLAYLVWPVFYVGDVVDD